MAERRTRVSVSRRRWPAMVAAGVAVVSAGFAIGIVAGIVWEEPGLVLAYLTGDTERISWGPEPDETFTDGELPRAPSVVVREAKGAGENSPQGRGAVPHPAPRRGRAATLESV